MKKEKNMKYNTLDANSFGSMSSMISKKLRRATSSFLSRTSYSSSSSSTDSSPTASSSQQQQKQQHNDASTTERSSTLSNTFDTSKSFNENKTKLNAKSIGKYKNDAVSECSCNYRQNSFYQCILLLLSSLKSQLFKQNQISSTNFFKLFSLFLYLL